MISKKNKSAFLTIIMIFGIFSPYISLIGFKKIYNYYQEEQKINGKIETVYSQESSLYKLPKKISSYRIKGVVNFGDKKDFIVFKFDKSKTDVNDIKVRVIQNGKQKYASIDFDGDERMALEQFAYSEPIFINPDNNVSYEINSKSQLSLSQETQIIGLNTTTYTESLTIGNHSNVNAEDDQIVSRKDWGADETLRYADNPKWIAIYSSINSKVKSEWELKQEQRIRDIRQYLATNFSLEDTPISNINEEKGHKLVWPIEKTKIVDKIFIHHTAESVQNDSRDDASIMRAMYYYHSITRGWGDIGYNFVVGRDGQLYEGRAGGDYSVAAHNLWNNKSTVGISVMGNFQDYSVNEKQRNGVDRAIGIISKKYGIDINKTSISHRECSTSESCLLKDFDTPNLSGHKDAGNTSCPGTNLYSLLGEFRDYGKLYSSGLTSIENRNLSPQNSELPKGPNIKIKLSFSGITAEIRSYTDEKMKIQVGNRKGVTKLSYLKFVPRGTDNIALVLGKKSLKVPSFTISSTVLEVSNWSRIPAWDQSGSLNDNKFRGTLTVYNDNGKLAIINELPLEDYMKGLAEISNQENEQKAKTILVAARSYALWYTKTENRKFPGKSYDGSDDPDIFQKYLGYGFEQRSSNIINYVDDTNSVIIKYNGNLIKPWYFNASNGQTRSAKQYCQLNTPSATCLDIPYLQSVIDPGVTDGTFKGHGVGISGNGAKALADQGKKYDEIIKYFLTGVTVEKITY